MTARLARLLVSFGRFWWAFLVGDTPELFLGTLVVIAVALALRHDRPAAFVAVPACALGFLGASTFRGRRRAAKS
jgi:hypothetical protein